MFCPIIALALILALIPAPPEPRPERPYICYSGDCG